MTDDDLAATLAALRTYQTDLRHVEAKRARTDLPRKLWQSISAFANTPGGGTILLGLDEDAGFVVTGVDDPRKIMQDLGSACASLEPPVRAVITPHRLEGRTVVVAEIPELPRERKPCFHPAAGVSNGAYVRTADGDHQLSSYEANMLLAARGQPREDIAPVPEARIADLDAAPIRAFVDRVRSRRPRFAGRSDEDILRTMKVLVPAPAVPGDVRETVATEAPGSPSYVPSLAALLVFSADPQSFFPQLGAVVTVYPGRTPGETGPAGERFLDDLRCEGSIAQIVAQVLTVLRRNMRRSSTVTGAFRTDRYEYPEEAIREALVNALAHRDFSAAARGTPVLVQLFSDRLVITNPGGLFGPLTVDTLGVEWLTSARNQILMQLLEDSVVPGTQHSLAEHRGSGIGAMLEALRTAGMSPPRFDDTIATFRVTFPRHSLLDADALAWLSSLGAGELTDTQRMALAVMRDGDAMTNSRYRQVTGAQDSRVVTRELRELVDRGLVSSTSAGRWTRYSLAPTMSPPSTRPLDAKAPSRQPGTDPPTGRARRADRRPDILRALRDHGALSRADLARLLHLSGPTVNRWLARLRRDRAVVLTTDSPTDPNARYRIPEGREGPTVVT